MSQSNLTTTKSPDLMESFSDLLEESFVSSKQLAKTVITGTVIAIESDVVIVDVGLKSEGRIPLREFGAAGETPNIAPGDQIDVYLERMENRDGQIILSYEKARREAGWKDLEESFQANERVNGIIFGTVKGGFTVELNGGVAFLPGSQVDVRPIKDVKPLMNIEQPFQIVKMDRKRGNIVVSRRAVLEESRAEARSELISNLQEGQILEGIVKNLTDYGAFIDLGGVDGLLHVTDISWRRVNHPSDALKIGQKVKVQVIRFNSDTQRISLGMKQLEEDPWGGVALKYPLGTNFEGKVTNITDYGAFVELEEGIEGLAHVSEMSWTKKGVHPNQLVSVGQTVNVKVLSIDADKRRIALGIKQCVDNPWEKLQEQFPIGNELEGEIKNITEFGLFVGMNDQIDGMVHMSDLSWSVPGEEAIKEYKKGQTIKVKVIDIDSEKERVVLGVKQLEKDPFEAGLSDLKRGSVVTCEVVSIDDEGIEVRIGEGLTGYIRKADLSKERDDRRPDRYAVGEKVDAKVMSIDRKTRRVSLSIKAREVEEEKQVMAEYG
ncbi:MAG: 30S ribosomal protein S1, partial [Alphaproteobacteria bacterium]|nr:30S ribosomal protein S1 [Alphaproteobacteria bacterium]